MQLGVFLMATSVEKFFVAVFMLSYSSLLDQIGTFLFMAIRPFPALELTIVMVVCPFFMSMIQFWVSNMLWVAAYIIPLVQETKINLCYMFLSG